MSQYGDGEYCEVSRSEPRRARKEHTCSACSETIAPGSIYEDVFLMFQGTAHCYKRCQRCEAIYQHLSKRIHDSGEPEEFCDERLHCGHDYRKRWEEDPPEDIAALAFWLPGDPLPPTRPA